ncbi:MAG: threonine--tRNA ligase [Elusimicrobia bacterium]|nr:threonine--tRNA ligase [Candidatus Obscuribacterium magneticum]
MPNQTASNSISADKIQREEYLYKLRHSTSHVMAQAVQELFPGTLLTIGPPTEDGFYYDFDSPHRFTTEDLDKIEECMRKNLDKVETFIGEEKSRDESIATFKKKGGKYKVEIIKDLPPDTKISFFRHGNFVDLCKGPHLETTKEIKHFKLLKIAGAYWRGDEKREQLQRIYGTVWPTDAELKDYLHRLEEAKKRDHRELGPRLGLFSIQPEKIGSGLILWHPKGAMVRHLIENYLRELHLKNGYQLAVTPHVGLSKLWETSGHLSYYKENMFPEMKIEEQGYYVKPMTCPFHITIYNTDLHSYRELPLRLYEHGTVYRYERSGVIHGTLRVRGFTQDDSHIFCRFDQLLDEIRGVLSLGRQILQDFGFHEYEVKLSTRPTKFVGDPNRWEEAEKILAQALKEVGFDYDIDPGEGVFYGPKIDLKIKDCIGRKWQCTTIQIDFNLPERFQATYRNDEGKDTPVCMVHRAVLGSMERFFGILIEQYAGAFPLWLAPVQAAVLPISEKQTSYAQEVLKNLVSQGVRAELNEKNEKIGAKIRMATLDKIPYMLVLGEREKEAKKVAVRTLKGEDLGGTDLGDFIAKMKKEIDAKSH